jgi:dsDNA-specific endonuclease/ATPase MutS2
VPGDLLLVHSRRGALEFPAIVERLAAAAATPHGAELVRALVPPSADRDDVSCRQALTAEAVALLDISAEPALEGPRCRTPIGVK